MKFRLHNVRNFITCKIYLIVVQGFICVWTHVGFKQTILKWSFFSIFVIVNIEIITFNSGPITTAEQQTTTKKTNDGSKDNVITIIIETVSGTIVLIVIIIIIIILYYRNQARNN